MQANVSGIYLPGKSIIHTLDPRTKIIVFLLFIFSISLVSPGNYSGFGLYAILLALLLMSSGLPFFYVIRRSLIVLPFSLLVAVSIPFMGQGDSAVYSLFGFSFQASIHAMDLFFAVSIKSYLSAVSMIILTSTTPFASLLKGFESLHMPKTILLIISFMLRYLSIFADEIMSMRTARDARSYGGNRRWHIRTLGHIITHMLVRAYMRGERVYCAMVSRGFSGNVHMVSSLKMTWLDFLFLFIFFTMLILINVFLKWQ